MHDGPEIEVRFSSTAQALALAQFVKRITWSEIRACAVDDTEAYEIRDAIEELQCSLAEAGFAPR